MFSKSPLFGPQENNQVMANVQRQIEEKKLKIQEKMKNIPTIINLPPPIMPIAGPSATNGHLDYDGKARIAELKAQIQARFASTPELANGTSDGSKNEASDRLRAMKPTPLILNSEGRTVDQSGKEVQLIQRLPTLKANIRAQKKEYFVKLNYEKHTESGNDESKFVDGRLDSKAIITRARKGLQFHEKGTFESIANDLRAKARLRQLQKVIAQKAKKTGISVAARLSLLSSIVPKKEIREDVVPAAEWWDTFIMKNSTYEECIANEAPSKDKYDSISQLIEHPFQMKPPYEPSKAQFLPVFLTKKEQKKLRRQNRREAWKEKQEKIRLGLEQPPEPKLKISNMMRALGQKAVQDPTKIEARVKEQMLKRIKAHEEANAARKLTGEQKKKKKIKKIREDTNTGVHVAVYRVLNLNSPAKKFKVQTNIKQLLMSGVVVIYKNVNVIVVEGGPKQQRRFKRLMLHRIKWAEDFAFTESNDPDAKKAENKCFLVWEGLVKNRTFGEVKLKISPNESFAREIFKNKGVEHYWDLAFSMSILDSAETAV